ncbi:MAG: hypothetical protein H6812_00185 [Phycisphaeraceae bacterium]|nr:hypothetical protein [Phycisphaeraceae bacterium]
MSEQVPGFTVEPAAIINMIRENLVDRYRDAYAIVKELIQNSDDAKATRMELGWCNGLGARASHPLLKGPAVFVVNNGAFDSSNAKAIRRIYLSSKSNRRDSIGQFGLGMKSVFHVCEAFFYAWNCRGVERDFSGAEVLNPWGGLCHAGWNEFSQADQALLRQRLAPVIDGEVAADVVATLDWFALWLPLRLPAHSEADGDLIFERFYGESLDDLGLFDTAVLEDLPTLLPLLRHLELIRGWRVEGSSFSRVFEAALGRSSRRCSYKEGMSFGRTALGGGIKVRNSTAESRDPCVFAGVEAYVKDDQLRAIMERPDWPRIETTDERNMPTAVRRKAEPHGAVCFAGRRPRSAEAKERHLTLRIRWAVFLPLQPEHDEVVPPGSLGGADYTLTLHGWYFVDSGRQRIDMPASVRVGEAEVNIRHEWNGRLMESATLPLLIPALDRLAESIGHDHPDLGELTGLLMRSAFFSVHRRAICSQAQWVKAFGQDGVSWKVLGTSEPVLVLPGEPSDRDLAWRTFRALADLTRRAVVTFERAPRLCGLDEQEAWPLEAVEAMLAVDVAAVCGDAESLRYCASFVSSLPRETIDSDRVQVALMALVRGALHTVGTREFLKHENHALRQALSRLIQCVRATSVVGVTTPKGLDVAMQEVLTRLAGEGRGLLVVPGELRGRAEPTVLADAAGCVALVQEVGRLQTVLEQGPQGARTAAMTRACAWVARAALLSAADQVMGDVLQGVDAIKLFPATMYRSEGTGGRVSVSELRSAQASGTLFCGVPRYAKPMMGALSQLPLVGVDLSGDPILDEELQSRLLGNDRIPACDLRLCIRLVSSASELAVAREARMPLFEAMVRDGAELSEEDMVRCLRYLLHGQRRLFEREAEHASGSDLLLVDDEEHGSAWRVLFDAVVGCRGDHWRRLSAEACRKLNADQMRKLGVSRIDRGTLMVLLEQLQPSERHGVSVDDEEARRELLRSWPESHLHLLKDVALHRRTGSKALGPLDEHTFLRGSFRLPEELGGALSITLVEPGPEYDYWAHRGSALAETFGLEQALREVLRVREPQHYWAFILDAVGELGPSCSEEVKQQVSTTAWVPTASGKAVSPVRVLSIPTLDDMLSELVGPEGPWHAWNDVALQVKRHPASRGAVQRCLSVPDAAGALCQYLAQHNRFRIGQIGLNSREMFEVWLAALRSDGQAMPAARVAGGLVQDLGIENAWSLVTKELATGLLDLDRLERVLTAVRLHHADCPTELREIAVRVHNEYLRLVAGHEGGASCLRRAQLLNQQGKWTPSTNLCVDSPGVSRAALLDVEQEAVIRRCLGALNRTHLDVVDAETPASTSAEDIADKDQLESAYRRSAVDIERYFVDWSRRLSANAIGGFFAFLGDHEAMIELAGRYLRPISLRELRHQVPWSLPEVLRGDTRVTRPQLDSIDAQMQRRRFIIEVVAEKATVVPNLFGDAIRVNLSQDFEHIVLHHSTHWVGGDDWTGVTRLQLRRVPPEELREPDRAKELLQRSLAWLLENIFRQRPSPEVLAEIVDPDRDLGALNVRIVQNVLLDALPVYLQQISYRGTGEVRQYLDRWNRATYAKAEAELELEKPGGRHEEARAAMEHADREHRKLRESMRQVLLDDKAFQREILESVRRKMHVAQYSAASVPFELFQNADDAVSEWSRMRGQGAPLNPAHRRFVVVQGPEGVTFLHWGRPVNRARLGQFDGSTRRYQDDLLKMLTIAASDKSADESQEITTGRFGYGFKSTFFVSPEPVVVSGRLGVRIVAGFYPDELGDDAYASATEAAERWEDPGLDGDDVTVIRLGFGVEEANGEAFLDRFLVLSPLLPVFSREISRISMQRCDGTVLHAAWNPEPVPGVQGAFVGVARLPLGHGRAHSASVMPESRCLVVHAGPPDDPRRCQLLVPLSGRGIGKLAEDVPTIWVTAPTHECCRLGFAFHAPFELHIARGSLAPESVVNGRLVCEAGTRLGDVLVQLFDHCTADWSRVRDSLGLDAGAEPYEFWRSAWERFGESVGAAGDEGPATSLMRELLWGATGAVRVLVGQRAVLPTGLPNTDPLDQASSYERLVRLDEPEYVVYGRLAEEDVFLEVAFWKRFGQRWAPGTLMHPRLAGVLARLLGDRAPKLGRLGLVDAVEHELDAGGCAPAEVAARMGTLISPEFVSDSSGRESKAADDERDQLTELLESVKFRGCDGGWHPAGTLVVGHDASDSRAEDRRRAAFAPAEHVLDAEYSAEGLQFFYACRYGQGVKAETIARWMTRESMTDTQRRSVLEYLATSADAERVSHCLRGLGSTWLSNISRNDEIFEGMEPQHVAMALQRGNSREWEQFVRGEYQPAAEDPADEEPLPQDAVLRIAAWWKMHGEPHLANYYRRLLPDGQRPDLSVAHVYDDPPVLENGGEGLRRGWMTLFLLGAMQSMGRSRPEQHRGFVQRCLSRGWLDTFATPPHQNADRWIGLLKEYFDPQLDDQEYLHWMSLYPRIYQFGHWLHQYVWWFKILDHQESIELSDLLVPRSSRIGQGTEIDAPPLTRALGLGSCLVVRELVRSGFLRAAPAWARYSYMPSGRVRMLVQRLGLCELDEESAGSHRLQDSQTIHDSLAATLRDPTFGGAYDIPLQVLAADDALLEEVMQHPPLSQGPSE